MRAENPIIEVKNLSYTYPKGEREALNNISLSVRKGEILGIMGPTGAGKSTLCLSLSGLIPHSIGGDMKGEVIIDGETTTNQKLYDIVKKIGIVFQDPDMQLFGMEVIEDICFKPQNLGFSPEEVKERANWALQQVRLDGLESRFPYTLSGGQKQRLTIASILSARPEILILDEPTSELDPIGKTEVFDVIRDLRRSHKGTIIIVEHNSEELMRISDRIIVMKDGKILIEGKTPDVFQQVEELENLGLKVPQIIKLRHLFKKDNISLSPDYDNKFTIDDMYSLLKEFLIKKGECRPSRAGEIDSKIEGEKEKIIEIKDLIHVYSEGTEEEVLSINGIDLNIYKKDFVALIGQNGSGKTTLSKLIMGLLKPTKGKITVGGLDTKRVSVANLAEIVGYSYQNPDNQIFNTNIWDEVTFGLKNLFLSEDVIKERFAESIEIVGLTGFEEENPFMLSKDLRQKVAVASVLAMQPEIIIIDEPSTGMDWVTSIKMMELAKHLNQKGKTMIFITHDMYLVTRYAKRVIVLSNGKVLLDGSTKWVFRQKEELEKAFIDQPPICCLSQMLSEYITSLALTEEEFINEIKTCLMREEH